MLSPPSHVSEGVFSLAEMQNLTSFIGRFRPTPPFSWPVTVVFLYVGMALPIFCFAITLHEAPDMPSWQSGNAADIAALLLTGLTSFYLFPFLIHAVMAFSLLLLWPARFCEKFLLRWGVYSGVLVALHFSIALAFTLGNVATVYSWQAVTVPLSMLSMTTIPIWLGWWLLCWIARQLKLAERLRSRKSRLVLSAIVFAAVALMIAYCVQADVNLGKAIFFYSVLCAPFWTTAAFAGLSWNISSRVRGQYKFTLRHMLFVFSWITAYLACARESIRRAYEIYVTLPTDPQGCYIATAASHGHPWFVGTTMGNGIGQKSVANRQLLRFKLAEIALAAIAPSVHRLLRLAYNSIGPPLAERMNHRLVADLAYLLLKPAEWCSCVFVRILLPDATKIIEESLGETKIRCD
jgi:hypothetical protein